MTTPRRRLRIPVIGRLAWAWLAFACAGAGFIAYTLIAADDGAHRRVALPLADIERMARPAPRAAEEARMTALPPAPQLRGDAEEEAAPRRDPFDDPFDGVAAPAEDSFRLAQPAPDDIVITIDGAREGAAPLRPTPAAARIRIPDARPDMLLATPFGERPRRGAGGRVAAREYARPFDPEPDTPMIGLIVGGLGLNPALTERAIAELPGEVTLAFAPYAKDLPRWTEMARAAGHEILIELPMEAHGGDLAALGPAAIATARSAEENLQRLDWLLSRFGAYVGATNYLGGKFSADRAAMAPVLARLAEAGLAYFDDTGAVGGRRGAGQTTHQATFIDRVLAPAARRAALADLGALEALARREGDALAKTYIASDTVDILLEWTGELPARGLALAPASAIYEARTAR